MTRQIVILSYLEKLTEFTSGKAVSDLKLNFEKLTDSEELSNEEYALLLISLGRTLKFESLEIVAQELAIQSQISNDIINEAKQIPAIMGMLNTYYKFRFFVEKNDENAAKEYGIPSLRMNSLAKPLMPKETFELISIAVSILNSCEKCVIAHEKALMDLKVSRTKIHDVMRIAAVAKGLNVL
ncbi:carboxymuconolactone decarboxylase family protein [Fluviispira multicolorata]|uniref:Carboxymuconolactone decarboxylase-like domain-containing protein n=1 Tax=Fluviispira multicolorata TaxID=2654512 RepID=A0A833JEX6_9BACT|nr:carboxymuconolactone decarboxylase family protein [Fluviispira multicolorata]KAB8032134.1 hypothetical protein GCL57_05670 [Fluviispira multicolorata]